LYTDPLCPTPHPNPPPSKFPEPQLPSASLRRPQEYSGFFCPEQYSTIICFSRIPAIWSKTFFRGLGHRKNGMFFHHCDHFDKEKLRKIKKRKNKDETV
jgi:hypothetical protein